MQLLYYSVSIIPHFQQRRKRFRLFVRWVLALIKLKSLLLLLLHLLWIFVLVFFFISLQFFLVCSYFAFEIQSYFVCGPCNPRPKANSSLNLIVVFVLYTILYPTFVAGLRNHKIPSVVHSHYRYIVCMCIVDYTKALNCFFITAFCRRQKILCAIFYVKNKYKFKFWCVLRKRVRLLDLSHGGAP